MAWGCAERGVKRACQVSGFQPLQANLAATGKSWFSRRARTGVVAGVEVGDVLGVRVEPVERVADLRGRALEAARVAHRLWRVEVHEPGGRVDLVEVGRAQRGEQHRLAVHGP